ncbi:MAG: hypothetical protein MUP70_02025 [Candidatus Aminicenantes bacterium]|nr:hypothetical protein [Candidatus Aminicenantes bacterium]
MSTLNLTAERIYKKRFSDFQEKIAGIKRIEIILALYKMAVAAAGIYVLFRITTAYKDSQFIWLGAFSLLFTAGAMIHEGFIRRRTFFETLLQLNEVEIRTLHDEFPDGDEGSDFISTDHRYAGDIDLFGRHSVFHFCSRAETPVGRRRLADWLEHGAKDALVIRSRQEAVQELAPLIDLRQNIQAFGRLFTKKAGNTDVFQRLLEKPPVFPLEKKWIFLIHFLPILSVTLIVLAFFVLPWYVPLAFLVFPILLNRHFKGEKEELFQITSRNARLFKAYSLTVSVLEETEFNSGLLRRFQSGLGAAGPSASKHIRRLSFLAGCLELRRSEVLHPILNLLFLWDLHCACRIERWRRDLALHIPEWFRVIGETEALASFACLAFNHPEWVFPQIEPEGCVYRAQDLGHFLIPVGSRINNDFKLEGAGGILVVTGPNMAGKSTFLKTVGVNLVLGLAGAPVCARSCTLSPLMLYSSMKVSDSLDKNLSLFYAELQRLKNILAGIQEGERILFLLDEILKGTNVLDRQAGAVALLRQLTRYEAVGIVATHDLELTKLEKEIPDRIKNAHFDGKVEGDQLFFDYKLRNGRCESFNALVLMRKIGIDI